MTWTHFWDMNSGGGSKESQSHIYIEAPETEAKVIFYNRFGHSPERVSCTCCGEDYSISEDESLAQLTGYHRNCDSLKTPRGEDGKFDPPADPWYETHYYLDPEDVEEAKRRGYEVEESSEKRLARENPSMDFKTEVTPLAEYVKQDDVLVIPAAEIKDSERKGTVPAQGYVWAGG